MSEEEVTREQRVNDLKSLAEWLESNPEVPVPTIDLYEYLFGWNTDKDRATFIAAARVIGATGEYQHSDGRIRITKRLGSASFSISVPKDVVGTRRVTTKEVEVEEWDFPFITDSNLEGSCPTCESELQATIEEFRDVPACPTCDTATHVAIADVAEPMGVSA